MKSSKKILLLSHPRSGSTSLYEILQTHRELDILAEPFAESFVNWSPGDKDYRGLVHDAASLDEQLDEIFSQYDGFKLQDYQLQGDEVGGLPRAVDDNLLEHLLLRQNLNVVFLRRRNLLQAVVSNLIGEQTGVWKKSDLTRPLESHYSNLTQLNVVDVCSRIGRLSQHLDWCESLLSRECNGRWLPVVYEDFFLVSSAEQAETLNALWKFLGLEPIAASEFRHHLRPEIARLNSPATYALVPNIQQLNDECGSDAHGWLFDGAQQGYESDEPR